MIVSQSGAISLVIALTLPYVRYATGVHLFFCYYNVHLLTDVSPRTHLDTLQLKGLARLFDHLPIMGWSFKARLMLTVNHTLKFNPLLWFMYFCL
jgi:hypothetical protein